jgi:hypothetical protein
LPRRSATQEVPSSFGSARMCTLVLPMSATGEERRAGPKDVEQALVRLLAIYSTVSRSLSEWEQHCLSTALVFARHGYFENALIKIGEVFEPPVPLPPFPKPPPITLDYISRHVTAAAEKPDPEHRPQAGPRRPPPSPKV